MDASLAYPDCTEGLSASIYNSEEAHAFLSRRRYDEHGYSTAAERYFPAGALEPSVFNEECGWVDFPDDLDRIEFMREFNSGEFHIADVYVVNHDQDNVMKFKPRSTGVFKVLLQQPESDELFAGPAEAAYDLEIGVYDAEEKKFLASSMNSHLRLPGGQPAKLEHAALSFQVDEEHVNRPLYVFFRALNFTDDGDGRTAGEGCLTVFLEAEYRAEPSKCLHDPALEPSRDIQVLHGQSETPDSPFSINGWHSTKTGHSISDPSSTFFTYQDFYLSESPGASSGGDSEYLVAVSLQQKFYERNTLDILVEILESDVALEDISRERHAPKRTTRHGSTANEGAETGPEEAEGRGEDVRGAFGPACSGTCLAGGEKAYNEMQRALVLGAKTYFRVWLFQ